MVVDLNSFIAAANAAEVPSRILLNGAAPEGPPVVQELSTGCFACLRNKLTNKRALNRMTIEMFTQSVREHYENDFVAMFVQTSLHSVHASGKALTAEKVLRLAVSADALFHSMEKNTRDTLDAQTAFHCANKLITPGTTEHNALLDSFHGDCAAVLLKNHAADYWPQASRRISRALRRFMEGAKTPPAPETLHAVAREALNRSLTLSLPFEKFYMAAVDEANDRLQRAAYSYDMLDSECPWCEVLNTLLMDAQLRKWPITTLELGFHQIVTEMVRFDKEGVTSPMLSSASNTPDSSSPASSEGNASVPVSTSGPSLTIAAQMGVAPVPEANTPEVSSATSAGRSSPVWDAVARDIVAQFPPSLWQDDITEILRMTEQNRRELEAPLQAAQKVLQDVGEYNTVERLVLYCDSNYRKEFTAELAERWEELSVTELADREAGGPVGLTGEPLPETGPGSWEDVHSPAAIQARRTFLRKLFGATPQEGRVHAATMFPMLTHLCSALTERNREASNDPRVALQVTYMLAAFWGPLNNSENMTLMQIPWFMSLCNSFIPDMLYLHAGFPLGGNGRYGLSMKEDALVQQYDQLARENAPTVAAFFDTLMHSSMLTTA